jgi:superfamily II RNA helicase
MASGISNIHKFTTTADNRGNWEFSFFQKKFIPNEEQTIKIEMKPENSFDPKLIHQYINPQPSKEELIIIKKNQEIQLNKSEQIIYDNYLKKKEEMINEDNEQIRKFGLNAKPITKEGKTILLLITLQNQISKGNIDNVCNIYLRLMEDQFIITDKMKNDFNKVLCKMEEIVSKCDLIELQFTKLHDQMPPLNTKGFQKFDPWQIDVINNIDNKISTIVSAPTSAGKTVLSGYATTKGRTLIIVPTDALAWQVASYVGGILNIDVPIITKTYQSIPKRDFSS